jgi:hypothetical protein
MLKYFAALAMVSFFSGLFQRTAPFRRLLSQEPVFTINYNDRPNTIIFPYEKVLIRGYHNIAIRGKITGSCARILKGLKKV